jgi:hypothetical protein
MRVRKIKWTRGSSYHGNFISFFERWQLHIIVLLKFEIVHKATFVVLSVIHSMMEGGAADCRDGRRSHRHQFFFRDHALAHISLRGVEKQTIQSFQG